MRKKFPDPRQVFINCPFDAAFRPLLRAMQFTIIACGYTPRSALEEDNAVEVRVSKIMRLIRDECGLGIHDISRTETDGSPPLPRFNMPFELGLHLGNLWTRNSPERVSGILILDGEKYRYQRLISDIAGQDIRSHGNSVEGMIGAVRKWLNSHAKGAGVPGTSVLQKHFKNFSFEFPRMLQMQGLEEDDLSFTTWSDYIIDWLAVSPSKRKTACPECGK